MDNEEQDTLGEPEEFNPTMNEDLDGFEDDALLEENDGFRFDKEEEPEAY